MSSYSVKMMTRLSFHGRRPCVAGRTAEGPGTDSCESSRRVFACGRRAAARPLSDAGISSRSAARGARGLRRRHPRRSRLALRSPASTCSLLLGLEFLLRQRCAVVVSVRRRSPSEDRAARAAALRPLHPAPLLPLPLDGSPVDLERPRERLDGGQQPLLQAEDEQSGSGLLRAWSRPRAAPRERPVLVEQLESTRAPAHRRASRRCRSA